MCRSSAIKWRRTVCRSPSAACERAYYDEPIRHTCCADSNQARGIAQYALDMVQGGMPGPSDAVLQQGRAVSPR